MSNFSITINGATHWVNLKNFPADITLNTFIREYAGLSGTKFMCQEGGCGVCVCVAEGKDSSTGEQRTWAINSCLTLLNTCNGLSITTVEGVGNRSTGYSAIQKRLVAMSGSQCGYCTPGFVANMYALLKAKNGKVTMEEVENSFGGNICRCTGYRPILDSMKSFAVDSNIAVPPECQDIEDLSRTTCPKTGKTCSGSCKSGAKLTSLDYEDGSHWYWPQTVADVHQIWQGLSDAEKYTLVAGNTGHGVFRRSNDVKHFIHIGGVAELSKHSIQPDSLVLGGNLSLSEAMEVFRKAATRPGFEYCEQLWNHFDLIANVPVRNSGTLAGNFALKHEHQDFPSDIFVAFEALKVKLVLSGEGGKLLSVEPVEYLKTCMAKKLIHSFVLPPYSTKEFIFDSYKIMPRAQNAHAHVNAAFLLQLNKATGVVASARLCFGGINESYVHASDVEQYLVGKSPFAEHRAILEMLFAGLQVDAVPAEPSPEYKRILACGLLYKFLLKHWPQGGLSEKYLSGGSLLQRPVSKGQQTYDKIEKNAPIHKPVEKHEGLIQASGQALYANDVPVEPQQLWAAFVTAKQVGGRIAKIDASQALQMPGVVAFFGVDDIPGENLVAKADNFLFMEDEEFLPTGAIKYYNQPVGVIVAESNALAQKAAELVAVSYTGGSKDVVPTLKKALAQSATDRMTHTIKSTVAEVPKGGANSLQAQGKLDMGLQYHYFLEPQTTVVVPTEAGLQVYSATQWMDNVQITISKLLNVKSHDVQVKVRRVGGGYGGKATRCNPAACAAALAAYKLNRPVRFVQSLESMMNTLGKRWAFEVDYKFAANKTTGQIDSIESTCYEDAGWLANESPMGHTKLLSENCYAFKDNYKLDGYLVLTDSPNNTACRAPGSVEGIAMIENILEHIAFETGVDPVEVRLANMKPGHKMADMLKRIAETAGYTKRKQEVAAFNEKNRWRKRGLGVSVSEYSIGYFGQFPATVAVYHNDGSVVITHGGIEMGQGMNTKIAQVAAHVLNLPLNMVRVEASGTINGANSMVTGGSIGSEVVCFAVHKCCNTLNERLSSVREELKEATWQQLVQTAYMKQINLIVSDDCKKDDLQPYTVCGVCVSEVEIDVLTGNHLVNRVDILEDTGESLNPAVDIGQIEGAFMMGLGYWTSEKIVVDETTGELKTNRTWTYKPPGAKDIPVDLRIELLPQSVNNAGFMGSKATGEPAICLAIAIPFAMQQAIQAARQDAGLPKAWVNLSAPMQPEDILLSCGTDVKMMGL